MRIKKGQTLVLKDGRTVDAEDEIKHFCLITMEAVLRFFAKDKEAWKSFIRRFKKNDPGEATACAIAAIEKIDEEENLFMTREAQKHE